LFDFSFVDFPSVLWHCWLGHQTCKNRRPYILVQTLNHAQSTTPGPARPALTGVIIPTVWLQCTIMHRQSKIYHSTVV